MLLDISDAAGGADTLTLIGDGDLQANAARYVEENGSASEQLIAVADVTLLPPIRRPGKIVCLAGNYGVMPNQGSRQNSPSNSF
jgi:hypothetical protein